MVARLSKSAVGGFSKPKHLNRKSLQLSSGRIVRTETPQPEVTFSDSRENAVAGEMAAKREPLKGKRLTVGRRPARRVKLCRTVTTVPPLFACCS